MTIFFKRAGIQLVSGLLMALFLVGLNLLPHHLTLQATLPSANAQAMTNRYVARMVPAGVVPGLSNSDVNARAAAGATLYGDRLVVQGHFRHLSGMLRDYALDPLDPPNPNITSAVHIHLGSPDENGPFRYAMTVSADASGLNGSFSGEIMLMEEERQALESGNLYLDIHTTAFRAGELRGTLEPLV